MNETKFEHLSNEVLIELFEHFNLVDLLYGFKDLNVRLNSLLFEKLSIFHLDLRGVSNMNYRLVVDTQHFPLIEKVQSIDLSNDDRTPGLPDQLIADGFGMNRFHQLRSLILYEIHDKDLLFKLTDQCATLAFLTHFSIVQCYFFLQQQDFGRWMNRIWNLPKLNYFYCDRDLAMGRFFNELLFTSLTIEHLSLKHIEFRHDDLKHLFRFTPNLRRLSMKFIDDTKTSLLLERNSTIIESFRLLANLSELTIRFGSMKLDGNQLESLLTHRPLKLRRFRFLMEFSICSSIKPDFHVEIDRILKTFTSRFWLEEHRWFIRCDWSSVGNVTVYTVPFPSRHFIYSNQCFSKWTGIETSMFDRVEKLTIEDISKTLVTPLMRFSRLRNLELTLPIDVRCQPMIIDYFHQLKIIFIRLPTYRFDYSIFQIILDRSINLYSLTVGTDGYLSLDEKFFHLKSSSIRRLAFINKRRQNIEYLNAEEFQAFLEFPLAHQCFTLCLAVPKPENILQMIKIMKNIRSLEIIAAVIDEPINSDGETLQGLIKWLLDRLPLETRIEQGEFKENLRLWFCR